MVFFLDIPFVSGKGDTHILTDRNDGPFVQESYDNFRPLGKTWAEVEALAAAKQKPRKHPAPIGGWVMRTDGGYPGVPFGTKAQVEDINDVGSYRARVPSGDIHAWSPEFCEPCEPPVEMPKNGDIVTVENAVAVVKEGCRQALQEERQRAKVGSYFELNRVNNIGEKLRQVVEPTQEPTYIVACPKGRRKYVKYYLSQQVLPVAGYIYMCNKDLDALPYSTADKPFWLGYVSAKLREELTALAPDIRFSVG